MSIRLHTFPSRDREFGHFAQEAFDALAGPATIAALQRAVRARYPAAVVTAQDELARHGDGPEVWYVFRTAAAAGSTMPVIERGGDDAPRTDAWAILDDERRFVEISPALATIAEFPARRMLGHRVEDFSNPADPTIRDDIERLWLEFRTSRSLASTLRFNYADGRPRELAYRLDADADGPGRHRLSVWVLSDE